MSTIPGSTFEQTRCVAVVDGCMILTEAGVLVYHGIKPPRVGAPGWARLRIVNQRLVQDRVIMYQALGRDSFGNLVATVEVGGTDVITAILTEAMRFNLDLVARSPAGG